MKRYALAEGEVVRRVKALRARFHKELAKEGVSFVVLWVFDINDKGEEIPALDHGGYPAYGVIRKTPVRDRAAGLADVQFMLCKPGYESMNEAERDALIDHEWTHVRLKIDPDSGSAKYDVAGRPILEMRKHDRQYGWFDEIVERHGEASIERKCVAHLLEDPGLAQLYFDFQPGKAAAG